MTNVSRQEAVVSSAAEHRARGEAGRADPAPDRERAAAGRTGREGRADEPDDRRLQQRRAEALRAAGGEQDRAVTRRAADRAGHAEEHDRADEQALRADAGR